MDNTYANCQSCGMPIKKDPGYGGTNADGSEYAMYCSYCYRQGAFARPNWGVTQMQDFKKGKKKEIGFSDFLAGLLTKHIPKLERWKS